MQQTKAARCYLHDISAVDIWRVRAMLCMDYHFALGLLCFVVWRFNLDGFDFDDLTVTLFGIANEMLTKTTHKMLRSRYVVVNI